MFLQWFGSMVLICIPGVYFMVQTEKKLNVNDDITPTQRLISHFILVILFSALGAFIVPKASILTPNSDFFTAMKYGLILGAICSIGNMLMYYLYLMKTIPYSDYLAVEQHYENIGILSRIFYGGFIEEVMFRWGIMSLVSWLSQLVFEGTTLSVILAVGISSVLFALVHIPSIKMVLKAPKPSVYIYTVLGNLWVGVFTGWAFLEAGIFSAILVHILFHLLWYPIQVINTKGRKQKTVSAEV